MGSIVALALKYLLICVYVVVGMSSIGIVFDSLEELVWLRKFSWFILVRLAISVIALSWIFPNLFSELFFK